MESKETAYHEAGHMVAAWELGLSITGATIVPDPDKGHQGHVEVPKEDRVRYADWADEHESLYARLVTYFAGTAASVKFTDVPLPDEAMQVALESPGSDYYNISDLILSVAGPDPKKQQEVGDRAQRHASFLIRARWGQVGAVAEALIERKTLDAAECRRVLEEAFRQ